MKMNLLFSSLLFLAWSCYSLPAVASNQAKISALERQISYTGITSKIIKVASKHFKCDGRQYCSQMTSREEAEFFLKNCPDTKMDGDRDGVPCENDSRF